MPRIDRENREGVKIEQYYTDPCTKEEICISKDDVIDFEVFEPVYAPVFVDMLMSGHKTLRNKITNNLEKSGYKYIIHLKYPMSIGTIIALNKELRHYMLVEYKGFSRKGAYRYVIKSMDSYSVNELDEKSLTKGRDVIRISK